MWKLPKKWCFPGRRWDSLGQVCSVCPGGLPLLFWEARHGMQGHYTNHRRLRDLETSPTHITGSAEPRNLEDEEKNPVLHWGSYVDRVRRTCTRRRNNRAPETVRSAKGSRRVSQAKELFWGLKWIVCPDSGEKRVWDRKE